MAMNFFKKKEKKTSSSQVIDGDSVHLKGSMAEQGFKRSDRKAKAFFDHGWKAAESFNYDYAILHYCNGLRHDPDNMDKHTALLEVALKRQHNGGKPVTRKQTSDFVLTKAVADRWIYEEFVWAHDPKNPKLIRRVIERALDVIPVELEVNIAEVVYMYGNILLKNLQETKDSKEMYVFAMESYEEVGALDRAVEACKLAIMAHNKASTKGPDDDLESKLKSLEAEVALEKGQFDKSSVEAQRDAEGQRKRDLSSMKAGSAEAKRELLEALLEDYRENPTDAGMINKVARAMVSMETDEADAQAIGILTKVLEETEQYKYRVQLGDIKIKQAARHLRLLKQAMAKQPGDESLKKKFLDLNRKKLLFEVEEFTDRVKHYPTELGLKYELGRRLVIFKKYDDAISMFQQSKSSPKHRAVSHDYLGQCYMAKGWSDEAVDTLKAGIEAHPITDDRTGLSLRYLLIHALEDTARTNKDIELAKEAQKYASAILQSDINYKDIRDVIQRTKKLVLELRGNDD